MSILSFSFPFGFSVILYFCTHSHSVMHHILSCRPATLRTDVCISKGSHLKDSIQSIFKALNLNLDVLPAECRPHLAELPKAMASRWPKV